MKYTLICADCGYKQVFEARTLRSYYDKARDNGWAINRRNNIRWCPNCAPLHRHIGRRGAARTFIQMELDISNN